MTFTVGIVGLGNIGFLYDMELPSSSILSHSRAIDSHKSFTLEIGSDKNLELCQKFSDKYGVESSNDIRDFAGEFSPDVFIISSPTNTHLTTVKTIIKHFSPKAILCEKPISYKLSEAKEIVNLCNANKISLYVNYIRRADPAFIELKKRISIGNIKGPYKAIVWYSKGLIHNGSHFVDLLNFLFGPIKSSTFLSKTNVTKFDADIDFKADFENGEAIFYSTKKNSNHFSIEVVASNGRFKFENNGDISWQEFIQPDNSCKDEILSENITFIKGDMQRYQYNIADQFNLALLQKENTLCTGLEGLEIIRSLEDLISSK